MLSRIVDAESLWPNEKGTDIKPLTPPTPAGEWDSLRESPIGMILEGWHTCM